jgi:hypothetical protein
MNWLSRLLVAVLLVGGPVLWLPVAVTDAAFQSGESGTAVRGPADVKKDDPDDLCGSGNPRKQKKCHYNGWDLNTNDNGDGFVLASDTTTIGATVTQDGLTIELWRSTDSPVITVPMSISVKGDGAAIERVWWWAEGPVYQGPFVDDLAFVGEMSHDCGGSQPCAGNWLVVTRYLGPYVLHAKIRDTAGREVQTDWKFDTIEQR